MAATVKESISRLIPKIALICIVLAAFASAPLKASPEEGEEFNPGDLIIHHVLDDHIWHFFDGHYGTLYLPVIAYSPERGIEVFSSSNLYDEHHEMIDYNGYSLEQGHLTLNEAAVFDFSITKNVLTLLFIALFMIVVFRSVAMGYTKNEGRAPSGIQSFFEPIIVYVKDEIVRPNISHNHERYLPYLLTLFFFVLLGNLFGLFPGAANLTGNIAVTLSLALFTFIITNVSGNKGYWGHIFNPPGVPILIKPLLVLVEFIGIFTKPISLTIRLFVAITAGHIVILSLIALIFIFQSYYVGIGSTLIVLFINFIELLVAGIQAYVFTMFSALYIGLATEQHH